MAGETVAATAVDPSVTMAAGKVADLVPDELAKEAGGTVVETVDEVAATADEVVVKMALATEVDSRVAEEDSNNTLRIELCTCRAERGSRLRAPRRCSTRPSTWSR